MNKEAIVWLNSPESDEWRKENFQPVGLLVTVKDDSNRPFDFYAFLWRT